MAKKIYNERETQRLWHKLLAIHPTGQFWQDPKNKDKGFEQFQKSLMADNPIVLLQKNERYYFSEEKAPTIAHPPIIQAGSTTNDVTAATAEIIEISDSDSENGTEREIKNERSIGNDVTVANDVTDAIEISDSDSESQSISISGKDRRTEIIEIYDSDSEIQSGSD